MNATSLARAGLRSGAPLAALLLCVVVGCSPRTPLRAEVIRPVKTAVVTAGEESHQRVFPGKVEASNKVELAFQVPGVLVELPVKEGQKVAKGDLIARVRDDEFRSRLKALQGQLDQARAGLRALQAGERPEQRRRLEAAERAAEAKVANARSEFERDRRLLPRGAVSRETFERSQTALRLAQEELKAAREASEKGTTAREEDIDAKEGAVRALEARVVEAQLQVNDTELRAPYDGVIARRFVEPNQNVTAKQPIVRFQDVDEIDIAVDVPESVMAADLRSADILRLTAEFTGAPGREFPVRIKEVAQKADPVTQTFLVRVRMKVPPDANLLPGMTGTVNLTYRRASVLDSRILVPIAGVGPGTGEGKVAWVVEAEADDKGEKVTKVVSRPVKVGEATGARIEILDGLQAGDRIVVAGLSFLREGMQVRDLGDGLGGGQP